MSKYLSVEMQREASDLINDGKPLDEVHLLALAQALAAKFYAMQGYVVRPDFDFNNSTHGHEQLVWAMAVEAVGFLRNCDASDILAGLDDDE